MMRYVKWTIRLLALLIVAGFLVYTLPRHDIVRIVGTNTQRVDLNGWTSVFWSGSTKAQQRSQGTRDVLFIQSIYPNGKDRVFRNEDTSWGWPPYFKFDTASLQTQAEDLKSTSESPKWVVITYYGMRSQILTTFPNAISMRPVDGPDVTIIPWFNIIFLTLLVVLALFIRALWRLFVQRKVTPFLARWRKV